MGDTSINISWWRTCRMVYDQGQRSTIRKGVELAIMIEPEKTFCRTLYHKFICNCRTDLCNKAIPTNPEIFILNADPLKITCKSSESNHKKCSGFVCMAVKFSNNEEPWHGCLDYDKVVGPSKGCIRIHNSEGNNYGSDKHEEEVCICDTEMCDPFEYSRDADPRATPDAAKKPTEIVNEND